MLRKLKRKLNRSAAVENVVARPGRFSMLENLEGRRMFSTISVDRFGAVAGDGRDDAAAVRSAIRAASVGDTITFGAGTYNINSQVDIPLDGGLTLDGGKVATIVSARKDFAFHFRRRGLTIQNFNVDGGLLFIEPYGNRAPSNITVDWNTFTNIDQGGDVGATRGAIGAPGARVNNLTITNNDFEGSGSGMCINIYTGDNWNILNNAFVHVLGSIKSNNAGNTANNVNINGNYFSLNRRHAVELQGCVNTFNFNDNYYVKPNISSDFHSNDSTFAFSLIYTATSSDQHIMRNYIVVDPPAEQPDGLGPRLAFEAGEHAEVTDNYVIGTGTFATAYGPQTMVHDNKIKDQKSGQGYAYGPGASTSKFWNNGWDTELTWDINRPIPGPGGHFTGGTGGGGGGGSNPAPVTGPTTFTTMTATVLDSSRVRLNWKDLADETGYRVERSLDGKTFAKIFDSAGPDILTYTDKGLPAGTQLWYRVVPYNANGDMTKSNTVTVKTKGTASNPRT